MKGEERARCLVTLFSSPLRESARVACASREPVCAHSHTHTRPLPPCRTRALSLVGRGARRRRGDCFQWGRARTKKLTLFLSKTHTSYLFKYIIIGDTGAIVAHLSSRPGRRAGENVEERARARPDRARVAARGRRSSFFLLTRPTPALLPFTHRRRQVLPTAPIYGQAVPAGARPDHRRRVW